MASAPAAAAAPAPAVKAPVRKPRAVARATLVDLLRYAAPRYEPRYDPMERGPHAFLRQYGSYDSQEY